MSSSFEALLIAILLVTVSPFSDGKYVAEKRPAQALDGQHSQATAEGQLKSDAEGDSSALKESEQQFQPNDTEFRETGLEDLETSKPKDQSLTETQNENVVDGNFPNAAKEKLADQPEVQTQELENELEKGTDQLLANEAELENQQNIPDQLPANTAELENQQNIPDQLPTNEAELENQQTSDQLEDVNAPVLRTRAPELRKSNSQGSFKGKIGRAFSNGKRVFSNSLRRSRSRGNSMDRSGSMSPTRSGNASPPRFPSIDPPDGLPVCEAPGPEPVVISPQSSPSQSPRRKTKNR